MNKTVLGVTSGEYSEYHIHGLFTTKAKAKAYLNAIDGKDAAIEEFALDPPPPEEGPKVTVYMDKSGHVHMALESKGNIHRRGFEFYADETPDHTTLVVWTVAPADKERAIKVVNEKRAMLITAGVWDDNDKTRKMLEART